MQRLLMCLIFFQFANFGIAFAVPGCLSLSRPLSCGTALSFRSVGTDESNFPKLLYTYEYGVDIPMDKLVNSLQSTDGKFLLGWDVPDKSMNFQEVVKVSRISSTDNSKEAQTARRIWKKSVDRSGKFMHETGFAEIILKNGLRTAESEDLFSNLESPSNPGQYSIFIRGGFLRGILDDNIAKIKEVQAVRWWHTHPNGQPFSISDFINVVTEFRWYFMEDKNSAKEFHLYVVSEVGGILYVYESQPRSTVMK